MSTVKERVEQEKVELTEKISRLTTFVNDESKIKTLSGEMARLLVIQLDAMNVYLRVLESRIALMDE